MADLEAAIPFHKFLDSHVSVGCLTSQSTIFQLYIHVHVTAHTCRCASGLKKFDIRSGSHVIDISYGSSTCPSKHRHGTTLFMVIRETPHFSLPLGIRRTYSHLKSPGNDGGGVRLWIMSSSFKKRPDIIRNTANIWHFAKKSSQRHMYAHVGAKKIWEEGVGRGGESNNLASSKSINPMHIYKVSSFYLGLSYLYYYIFLVVKCAYVGYICGMGVKSIHPFFIFPKTGLFKFSFGVRFFK